MLMSIFLTSLRTDTQLCFTEKNVYINVISFFFFILSLCLSLPHLLLLQCVKWFPKFLTRRTCVKWHFSVVKCERQRDEIIRPVSQRCGESSWRRQVLFPVEKKSQRCIDCWWQQCCYQHNEKKKGIAVLLTKSHTNN